MEAEVTIATDSGRSIEGIVPAQHRWLFTRRGEEGQPLLALHPDRNNDDYRRVTFLAEATRPAKIVDVEHSPRDRARLSADEPRAGQSVLPDRRAPLRTRCDEY